MVTKIQSISPNTGLFHTMANSAPVLLWMSREDSLCVFFNKTWLDFTGRTLEQEWGTGWLEGVYFEDFQQCVDTYIQHFNQRQSFEMEYRLRRHDGEYRWILDRGVPYYGVHQEFLGFIGSCIDITSSKLAAEFHQKMNIELEKRVQERTASLKQSELALELAKTKAEEASSLKSLFVSTVSHELRTPLTVIKSSLDLIMQGSKGELPETLTPLLQVALRNSERMLRLINDILDVEKIEAGKFTLNKKPQLILPLIRQAIASNTLFAAKYNVRLQLGEVIPKAHANVDADRLIQVLDNLLSNATKFTRANTEVVVSMQHIDGRICIAVKDKGEGIAPEFQSKMFSQFSQKENAAGQRQEGTGLGLSIAKSIMEQHQGLIRFETSKTGSTFYVEFPIA